ncbi:MAG: ABC transporter substrate-binding protein [Streptosporangiales bacterium]
MRFDHTATTNDQRNSLQPTRRQLLGGVGAAGLTFALGACSGGGKTGKAVSGGGGQTKSVTLVLDVAPYGKDTPFYVAKEKGFWSKRGLDVAIQHGKGSADTVTKIGAGTGEFGFADISAMIQGRANKNIDATMVCMFHYKNLASAQGLNNPAISEPKDLVGKTLVTTPGDADLVLLPALAKINGFDRKQVKISFSEYTSEIPAVVTGKADGMLNYFTAYPALEAAAEKRGKKASYFLYADYGLDIYNNGIMVLNKYLKSSPDQVKAFTAGFVEAVVYTVAHPDEAVQIFTQAVPGISADVVAAQQQVAINHLHVPEVEKHGFGPMDEGKVKRTLDIVNKYFKLKKPVSNVGDIFTNDHVPRGKVPKFTTKPSATPSG